MVCMKYLRLVSGLAILCFPVAGLTTWAPAAEPQSAKSSRGDEICRHGIKMSRCPFCTPSLKESDGTCQEHGVPEALCVLCRPFLKAVFQSEGDWCKEHDVPESQCAICNSGAINHPVDSGQPKSQAPGQTIPLRQGNGSRAALPPSAGCTKSATLVRLQSPEIVQTAGLKFVSVEEQPLTATITRNAEIVYNANRFARLAPRATGMVADVRRDLGDKVAPGDVLAIIDSAEVGSAKADLHQAVASIQLWKATAERERSLAEQGIGTEREAQEAENRHTEAKINYARTKQRLRNLGLSDSDVESVEQSQDHSSHLYVAAPFEGVVVERSAVQGEVVEPTGVFFAVANTQSMWAMIDLFEHDGQTVVPGQEVVVVLESIPGKAFPGKITWVSTQINPSTRTLKARAEISNSDGLLRANAFGQARIMLRHGERSLVVPKDAVQWDGCCNLVFVQANDLATNFQAKKVQLGIDTGTAYEVLSGLKAGETVVTTGSFLLKTEILKGSIGAGCCDHAVEKLDK